MHFFLCLSDVELVIYLVSRVLGLVCGVLFLPFAVFVFERCPVLDLHGRACAWFGLFGSYRARCILTLRVDVPGLARACFGLAGSSHARCILTRRVVGVVKRRFCLVRIWLRVGTHLFVFYFSKEIKPRSACPFPPGFRNFEALEKTWARPGWIREGERRGAE